MIRPAVSWIFIGIVLAPGPAVAQSHDDTVSGAGAAVWATVRQFVDGFNAGDLNRALSVCATQTTIVDEFAPHQWSGPGACKQWSRDLAAANAREGITGGRVRLGTPWHVDVEGNYAYVVVPTSYAYRQRGKAVTESGSVFTLALARVAVGWRITAWAWAAGR